MTDLQYKESKKTVFEKIGVGAVLFFFTGFVLYGIGFFFYLFNSDNSWELWLPLLMLFPFIIQILIFLRLYSISSKDREIETFFHYYTGLMCIGLFSYSFLWCIYNFFDIKSWSSSLLIFFGIEHWTTLLLTFFSFFALFLILFLIWSIINCTRIITRDCFEKNDGLLNSSDLSRAQREELCARADAILENESILDYDSSKLESIIKAQTIYNPEDDDAQKEENKELEKNRERIQKIIDAFSPDKGKIRFPVRDDSKVKEIISILTDAKQPARIKPLRRLIRLLKEDNNHLVQSAITKKRFKSIPKHQLIKSFNKILKDSDFFDEKDFSSGEGETAASKYFKQDKKRHLPETVQLENRKLFNLHILQKTSNTPNEENENRKPPRRWTVKDIKSSCSYYIKLGLNDDKGLKIKEGIARFPFETTTFFLTIFLCIAYLFSFSFAFHDKSELISSKPTKPALFMADEFSSDSSTNTSTNIVANATSNTTSANTASNTNTNSGVNVNSNSLPEKKTYKHPTLFVFYASAGSGIETGNDSRISQPASVLQQGDPDGNATSLDENQALRSYRFDRNKKNFDDLLKTIKDKALEAKTIYIEIVGRADDSPQNDTKKTYSSNYELSMARAQNLKFELIRQLQYNPEILEKIEWSCLPVSNDQSLGGDHPLNNSEFRPSIVMNSSSVLNVKDMIKKIDENFKDIPVSAGDKNSLQIQPEEQKKKILEGHIIQIKKLLNEGKIINKRAGDELFLKLQDELKYYKNIAVESQAGLTPDTPKYQEEVNKFEKLHEEINEALQFFQSGKDNANKRVTEIYITSIPKGDYIVPITNLTLMDFVLFTITTGEIGNIKPLTMYSKFLSFLVKITDVFFLVVFFNVLLSVKKANEEDEAFPSA
jgi:flagellar motor protein MotB